MIGALLPARWFWLDRRDAAPFDGAHAVAATGGEDMDGADLAATLDRERRAWERAAELDRVRVARDLHADLAAWLMGGLALDDPARLRGVIRGAIAELRDVVAASTSAPLANLLADSRSDASERLDAAGIALDWSPVMVDGALDPAAGKALTSALRELISNVLRHSQASKLCVSARPGRGRIEVRLADNGVATALPATADGGLGMIERRLRMAGGTAVFEAGPRGFRAVLDLPLAAPA